MTTPQRRPRPAFRPAPEGLEGRLLLSKTITGTDVDGDTWVLSLVGPGDLRVSTQNGPDGNPVPITQPAAIDQITVAGASPLTTRLVGVVTQASGGDGKVFFQNLNEIGGQSLNAAGPNGLLAIDMPGFWLGRTSSQLPTQQGAPVAQITIPDGVQTFRFGGADTTATPGGITPLGPSDPAQNFSVTLGVPKQTGTSIIVDRIVTASRQSQSTTSQTPTTANDTVDFAVTGRLNLFQANEIDGTPASDNTSRFEGPVPGGTTVASVGNTNSGVIGQIGDVRIGGNATNFTVNTPNLISNFYIGGETSDIELQAPGGSRNVYFGKGMDSVSIATHVIDTLQANRGAINSTVVSNRAIGRATFGGDVVGSRILSGYSITQSQAGTAPTVTAQDGGGMTVQVAGDVQNSVFAASAEPFMGTFGGGNTLLLPHGEIRAKVEGTIDNSNATDVDPSAADQAFFARAVKVDHGPVQPPATPEAPFRGTIYHRGQYGLVTANSQGPTIYDYHPPTSTMGVTVAVPHPTKPATLRRALLRPHASGGNTGASGPGARQGVNNGGTGGTSGRRFGA